jgi:hypothetical protein
LNECLRLWIKRLFIFNNWATLAAASFFIFFQM